MTAQALPGAEAAPGAPSLEGGQGLGAGELAPGATVSSPEPVAQAQEQVQAQEQQVQVQQEQTQEEQDYVSLSYWTYGNHGQFNEEIAILTNGMTVRPRYFADIRGKKTVAYGDVKAIVEVAHSRKHAYVKVYVPEDAVLAIVKLAASSSRFYTQFLYGEGRVENVVEDEATVSKTGKKKFVKQYEVTRYINEERGMNIVLRKVLAKEFTVPVVTVKLVDGRLEVYDAYDIKDALKKLGFRWDGEKKCWYGKAELLELVRRHAEVVMA